MVLNRQGANPLHALHPVMEKESLMALQQMVADTHIGQAVVEYAVALISATRSHPEILRGASPRATLAVVAMAKSIAQLHGRDYVIPADIRDVFAVTVAHRLILTSQAESQGRSPAGILAEILTKVAPPKLR